MAGQQDTGHYSPASVGGEGSARLARQVSSAYSRVYHRDKQGANAAVESLGLPPPGRPTDDLWSGSPLDEAFWRSDASLVVSRRATGLTREQRGVGSPAPLPPAGQPPPGARFCESTRCRSRQGR